MCLAHAIPVCYCPTLPVLTMFSNKKLAFGSACLTSRQLRHTYPYEMRHHLVTVTSSYIVASWLLRHQSRQVLITNFQDAVCKCVYVDCVGFISDVFAIVVQISDVKRSKLAIFFKTFQLRTWLQIYMYRTV